MSQNRNQKNTHRKKTETSKSRVSDKNTSAKSKSASKAAKASGKSTASPRKSYEKTAPSQNTRTPKTQTAAPGVLSRGEKQSGRSKRKSSAGQKMNIIPLGGLGEIGKNITLYEYGEDMFIVDCGMSFPDEELPGVDIVIPDLSYVLANKDRIRGLVVTHGHEDHIGAIPYLLRELNLPIYSSNLTIGLIKGKLVEHGLASSAKLNVVRAGDKIELGAFTVEFIHVNHSIPDAMALAITTPVGTVVQTGDFKIDTTPIDGEMIDIARLSELGKKGVLALLSDSTNAERSGFTMSESIVGETFMNFFAKAADKRIIVATFSSNIHRIQQIIDGAERYGRKVAVLGRSMVNVVNIATELGYLRVPEGILIDIDMLRRYTDDQLVIITTGSQGEPMSALHRMAHGDHRQVNVTPGDFVIISASPIPGNEKMVGKVINELMKLGAEVIYEKAYNIHVSGHACQEELKLMLGMVRPRFFIPVHGEQKHLVKHANLARAMGMEPSDIVIPEIGKVLELTRDSIKCTQTVQAGRLLVDGLGVGDVGSIVLRDRKHLSEDGILVAAMSVDAVSGELVSGPDLISRGFIFVKDSEDLMVEARQLVMDIFERSPAASRGDWSALKNRIRDELSKFFYGKTRRSPMVLPIIMEA
ncbi:MAG: ribonuclease J [Clostridia bacterium]|nr:ribonuclease J [Clostridia bacterium]